MEWKLSNLSKVRVSIAIQLTYFRSILYFEVLQKDHSAMAFFKWRCCCCVVVVVAAAAAAVVVVVVVDDDDDDDDNVRQLL
jgi:hypothetical protein